VHMPNKTSHSSQVRHIDSRDGKISIRRYRPDRKQVERRRSLGPLLGDDMLAWVIKPETAAQKRINAILELIVELRDLGGKVQVGTENTFLWQGMVFSTNSTILKSGALPKMSARQDELRSELNHRLRRYKLSPHYWCELGDRPIVGWYSEIDRPREEDEPEEDVWYTEEDAIICIVELARQGLFKDLRRCHCGDWLFARFAHQKFCCKSCQQAFYRSSPEYKAERRAYMKNNRALNKKTYFRVPKATKKETGQSGHTAKSL
jgi:hypothetical protein